ncbi:unnamed protein product [Phytomonas sp. Hart1]|nr:unnamed protein product [Phytomonas sp. Hart1]|eukprot:CCW67722.1 unnamed protein product [Phytomonas sp. isolate Hart1]
MRYPHSLQLLLPLHTFSTELGRISSNFSFTIFIQSYWPKNSTKRIKGSAFFFYTICLNIVFQCHSH